MRLSTSALIVCLLAPAALAAQTAPQAPRPDAPLARHVAHLLRLAPGGFPAVRGPGLPDTTFSRTTDHPSSYAIRFRGANATSGVRATAYTTMHQTRIPLQENANAGALWAAMADSIKPVIPAGWREYRRARAPGEVSYISWSECRNAGRMVVLNTHAPYEKPTLHLTVYQYAAPCPK